MTRVVVFGGCHFNDVAGLWLALDQRHALTPCSAGMEDGKITTVSQPGDARRR